MRYETKRPPVAVILAAGAGSQPRPLSDAPPKSLLSVGGSAILERTIRNCLSCGISQFVLVLGDRSDEAKRFVDKAFRGVRITHVATDRHHGGGTAHSLLLAAPAIGGAEFVRFDANVVFDVAILRRLVDCEIPDILCVDREIPLEDREARVIVDGQMRVLEIGESVDPGSATGEAIGIEKISAKTGPLLFAELARMMDDPAYDQARCEAAYARLAAGGAAFHALDITGSTWIEIDSAEDLDAANIMFKSPITTMPRGLQLTRGATTAKETTPG